MNRMPFVAITFILLTLTLGGCATPQAALDAANNGAALTVSLTGEIRDFRHVQSGIARARLDSVRSQRTRLANYDAEGNFDERLLKAADKAEALKLFATLKELSDSLACDETQLQDKLDATDTAFAKLLEPLPDATKELAATQKALAALGEELPTRERLATTAAFVKEIRQSVEDNRDKIEDAEKKAAAAPVEPNNLTD